MRFSEAWMHCEYSHPNSSFLVLCTPFRCRPGHQRQNLVGALSGCLGPFRSGMIEGSNFGSSIRFHLFFMFPHHVCLGAAQKLA